VVLPIIALLLMIWTGLSIPVAISMVIGVSLAFDFYHIYRSQQLKRKLVQTWVKPNNNKVIVQMNNVDEIIEVDVVDTPSTETADSKHSQTVQCSMIGNISSRLGTKYVKGSGVSATVEKVIATVNDSDDTLSVAKLSSPILLKVPGMKTSPLEIRYINTISTKSSSINSKVHSALIQLDSLGKDAALVFSNINKNITCHMSSKPVNYNDTGLKAHIVHTRDSMSPCFVLQMNGNMFIFASPDTTIGSGFVNTANTLPKGLKRMSTTISDKEINHKSVREMIDEQYIIPDDALEAFEYASSISAVNLKTGYELSMFFNNQNLLMGAISHKTSNLFASVQPMAITVQLALFGVSSIASFVFAGATFMSS
jgi:hypothetical protein